MTFELIPLAPLKPCRASWRDLVTPHRKWPLAIGLANRDFDLSPLFDFGLRFDGGVGYRRGRALA
jgi:hypothetical protein